MKKVVYNILMEELEFIAGVSDKKRANIKLIKEKCGEDIESIIKKIGFTNEEIAAGKIAIAILGILTDELNNVDLVPEHSPLSEEELKRYRELMARASNKNLI